MLILIVFMGKYKEITLLIVYNSDKVMCTITYKIYPYL